MTIVLVERFVPVIPGIGADVLAATSTIGDDVVQADITEAEAIIAARGFDVDPFLALESSGGWIAGLVLEPGRGDPATSGRLAAYLAADVRPRLDPGEDAFLVRCSVFDRVDRQPRDRPRGRGGAGDGGRAQIGRCSRCLGRAREGAAAASADQGDPRRGARERTDGRTSGRLDECGRRLRGRGRDQARSRRADRGRRSRRGQEALAVGDHGSGRAARRRGGGAAPRRGANGSGAARGDVRTALPRGRRAGGGGSASRARGARTRRERLPTSSRSSRRSAPSSCSCTRRSGVWPRRSRRSSRFPLGVHTTRPA